MKGAHFGDPGNGYDIYLWEGARERTIIHETYEIIHEALCDLESGAPPDEGVPREEADRFAAAVLMQPGTFADFARSSGLGFLGLIIGVRVNDYLPWDKSGSMIACWVVGVALGNALMLAGMAAWRLRRRAQ